HVSPLNPDVVVIQVGINDLKTIALFPERKDSIIEACKINIKEIVKTSKDTGAAVIVMTIFPAGEVPLERKLFWSDEIGQAIEDVNNYIATLADEETVVFDPFRDLADEQGKMLKKYSLDELHLNEQGYRFLNQKLAALITGIELKQK
ncbi:MAG: SGNH/GDSL hydrolase family protein, partial [Nodosilinea sp.]